MLTLRRKLGAGSWVRILHKSGDLIWIMVDRHGVNGDQVAMGFVDPSKDFLVVRKEVLDKEADKLGTPRINLP